MKITVPFLGVIKGRGSLVLASIISCALFYFHLFYLRKNRRRLSSSPILSLELATISSLAHEISESNDMFELEFNKVKNDSYDENLNPNGLMQLGVADNLLCLDLIEQWVVQNWNRSIGNDGEVGIEGIVPYQPLDGLMDLKLAIANFMSKVMGNIAFDPSRLVLTGGVTPAIEILAFCLGNPGDAFLIPAPYYSGDLQRTGMSLIPVHCRSSDNFTLTVGKIEHAYNKARNRGLNICGILLSNPCNPVGNLVPRETLHSLLDFAREKNIHIVSDEIFAGSVHGNGEFVSMAEMVKGNELDKNRVHIIYGLSKDLSLAGFRVGSIYTLNETVHEEFVKDYMEIYRKRVKKMHDLFVSGLEQVGIRCSKSDGGLFYWADMSRLIKPDNAKGEIELWEKLMNVGKLFIIPGIDFHCIEPGWFRCCFSALSEKDIPSVMERLQKVCDS